MDTDNTNGIALDRKLKREKFDLSDTEGLTITKENLKKLIFELKNAKAGKDGRIHLTTMNDGSTYYMGYSDFRCFCSALIKKYLKKA